MKKRLLSALLALALVFVLLPTTALAETPAIKIAGTVIEDGKYYYTNGGIGELKTEAQQKTWNVRRDGNTLYLKNAKINTTDTQSIQVWMMSVTINLEGDSTITTKGEGSIVSQLAGSLTINGNGKLTIESNTAGSSIVWNSGDVTITGDAVVNITNKNSGQLSEAIGLTNSYELTVSGNAKLKAVSNGSKAATVNSKKLTIADNAEFNVINQNSSGKAVSFKSIEVAAGYDCNGINGNGITDWTKTTAEELNTFQKVWVKPTPTPTLEKSNVCVAGTNLYKNTAYTIQNGKPVMGGTYPDNYNIYLDATNYVLHVKNADIDATGKTGISGTSNIVFEGTNSITASTYGIYSDFTQSDLKISGSGTLTINTTDGYPAIATQNMSIAIGGSLDVNATTIVTIATTDKNGIAVDSAKNLTISGAAKLSATSSYVNSSAIRVGNASKNTTGNLTVNSGATLIATSTSTKPTVQVGGNASFTGSTVAITNNSTTQGEQYKDSYEVSSALHVDGTIDISGGKVTATATAGGNAIRAVGDITVSNGAQVTATNNAEHFSAITAGAVGSNKEINTLYNLIVSGENTKITATNTNTATDLVYRAIHAHVYNNNTDFYLNMQSEGVKEELRNKNIAPGEYNYTGGHRVTITRGDAYTAPTTISKIIITGLTTPVKGETPVTTGVSLGTGLTVESITWGPALTSDGKFKAGTSYTAHIKYTVDEGYVLANKVDLSADGSESIVPKKDSNEIEVTFPLTAADTTHQHTSETGWQTDGTNHWKTCSTCSQNYDKGICTISGYNNDNGASGYHKVLCSVGHVMKTELHDYEYKITQNGTMHYKECKICHYTTLPVSHNFGSSGTETCECGAIPSHTHNLSGQRGHDDTNHWDICSECSQHVNEALHTYGDWITDTSATDTTEGSKHRTCSVCQYQENATIPKTGTGEIEPPTPDNPGTIVIIRPAEEEKPAQQPNPSTGANDLVGLAVAAAVAAALGSAALLRKHD